MNCLMPYESFEESAACLDRIRLGKQRADTLLIARCLAGEPSSWKNHPAVVMWRGYESALLMYQDACCFEWTVGRSYNDSSVFEQTNELLRKPGPTVAPTPWWLGDPDFHLAHQSNLLREDRRTYAKYFAGVPDDLPYRWPTDTEGIWK